MSGQRLEKLSLQEPTVDTLIFLGTGTSSQVPTIGCLTDPESKCRVCPSSLHMETQKNRRRNTSALITLSNEKNILIDCGKSFFEMALQIWPRAKLRQIDALLLTHAHADAMLGLDDLRGWTLGRFIQDSIQIYCSQATFDAVKGMFPYMIDSDKATGGGDIPAFDWHIINEDEQFWIESCGVSVETLKVEHGRYFDEARTPFICLGFRIGSVSYISDASSIPEKTRAKVEGSRVLILDALKKTPHASHFSIPEALKFVNALERPASRTYLIGVTLPLTELDMHKGVKRLIKHRFHARCGALRPGEIPEGERIVGRRALVRRTETGSAGRPDRRDGPLGRTAVDCSFRAGARRSPAQEWLQQSEEHGLMQGVHPCTIVFSMPLTPS